MWPAGLNRSFGGFCGATFVIGSGLGSLEAAANPYLAGTIRPFPTSVNVYVMIFGPVADGIPKFAVLPSILKSESTLLRLSTRSEQWSVPCWVPTPSSKKQAMTSRHCKACNGFT